jgi:hypothetical protein
MACIGLYKCTRQRSEGVGTEELHVVINSDAPAQIVFSSLRLHIQGDYLHKMTIF